MKVERVKYPGWNKHPCYSVRSYNDYMEIVTWMIENQVDNFLVSSGGAGCIFQVKTNHDWFVLRWI